MLPVGSHQPIIGQCCSWPEPCRPASGLTPGNQGQHFAWHTSSVMNWREWKGRQWNEEKKMEQEKELIFLTPAVRHRDVWARLLRIRAARKGSILICHQLLMSFTAYTLPQVMFPWCPYEAVNISLCIFVAIFFIAFLIYVYTKEAEMLCMCVCLTEPFSARRLLIQLEPPKRLTANWQPLSLGASVQSWLNKPRKSGESKRVKKHTSGPSRAESSGPEVSWPQGFEGPATELQVTSISFQDLPVEYSMCEHEKSFGVSWLQRWFVSSL